MSSLEVIPPITFLKPAQEDVQPILKWDISDAGNGTVCFWIRRDNAGRWMPAIYDTIDKPHVFDQRTGSSALGKRHSQEGRELRIGRYEFAGFPFDYIDPNDEPTLMDPQPLVRAHFAVLRDGIKLLKDDVEDFGNTGTQINAWANAEASGEPPTIRETYAVLRVDTVEPQHPSELLNGEQYPNAWLDFPSEDVDSTPRLALPQPTAYGPLSVNHLPISIASRSFLPGQPYWALLLVYTNDGKWQCKKKKLTMLQRTVEISFRQIDIDNDNAIGDGHAFFHWWVVERGKVAKYYHTGTLPINDTEDEPAKKHIGLSIYVPPDETPLVLGPYSIATDSERSVAIFTRAIGKHPFGTDDKTGNIKYELGVGDDAPTLYNFGALLDIPVGENIEKVDNEEFEIRTFNVNDDDDGNHFRYTLVGYYSIRYE